MPELFSLGVAGGAFPHPGVHLAYCLPVFFSGFDSVTVHEVVDDVGDADVMAEEFVELIEECGLEQFLAG